ncbi:TetR family transcriptional regulator [Xylanimonas ulmi]|uniref:TetR family transcriptional regulator n=1 Tax=Xylanimonas ulmi TaxID=228973 RepID=A0A4V2EY55_9MICO|nr:TetR family transcriptional regulator [Xylanibacterium ulmi]
MPYRQTTARVAAQEAKRAALLDAAHALLASGGFRAVSVKAVAARAAVSTGSVYSYFPDKSSLLAAAFRIAADVELDAVREACRPDPADEPGWRTARRLGRAVDTFARRAMRGRTLAWALLLEPVDPAVEAARLEYRRAYGATFAQVVHDGVAQGELPAQDVALSAAALVGAIGEALAGPLSPLGADAGASGAAVADAGPGGPAVADAHPDRVVAADAERDRVVAAILRCCLGVVSPPALPASLPPATHGASPTSTSRLGPTPPVPASKEIP